MFRYFIIMCGGILLWCDLSASTWPENEQALIATDYCRVSVTEKDNHLSDVILRVDNMQDEQERLRRASWIAATNKDMKVYWGCKKNIQHCREKDRIFNPSVHHGEWLYWPYDPPNKDFCKPIVVHFFVDRLSQLSKEHKVQLSQHIRQFVKKYLPSSDQYPVRVILGKQRHCDDNYCYNWNLPIPHLRAEIVLLKNNKPGYVNSGIAAKLFSPKVEQVKPELNKLCRALVDAPHDNIIVSPFLRRNDVVNILSEDFNEYCLSGKDEDYWKNFIIDALPKSSGIIAYFAVANLEDTSIYGNIYTDKNSSHWHNHYKVIVRWVLNPKIDPNDNFFGKLIGQLSDGGIGFLNLHP